MKSLLILILALALAAAAFITRPGKREFALYLLDTQVPQNSAWAPADFERADHVVRHVTFKDRYLWVDVERDGKVIYTGAFAHWVGRGEAGEKPALPTVAQLARLVGK
jgi:hypothetical protein